MNNKKMPDTLLYCHLDNLLVIKIVIENWFNGECKEKNVFVSKRVRDPNHTENYMVEIETQAIGCAGTNKDDTAVYK